MSLSIRQFANNVNLPIAQQYLLAVPQFIDGAISPLYPLIFSAINDSTDLSADQKTKLTDSIVAVFEALQNDVSFDKESLDSIADKFEGLAKLPEELLIKLPNILYSTVWPYLEAFQAWAFKNNAGEQLKVISVYSHFIFELITCDIILSISESNNNEALKSLKNTEKDALVAFGRDKLFSGASAMDLHKALFEISNKFNGGLSQGILETSAKNVDALNEIIKQEEKFTADNSNVKWVIDDGLKITIGVSNAALSALIPAIKGIASTFAPMLNNSDLNGALVNTIFGGNFGQEGLIQKIVTSTILRDLSSGSSSITLNSFENLIEVMFKVFNEETLTGVAENIGLSLKGLIDMLSLNCVNLSNSLSTLASTSVEIGSDKIPSSLYPIKIFVGALADGVNPNSSHTDVVNLSGHSEEL
ncbi:MAG: hypothetical protein K9G11_02280 [Rickettsiaceae bacterium]|nr:hypothetical protein [Rickettsiaceae bacterium]